MINYLRLIFYASLIRQIVNGMHYLQDGGHLLNSEGMPARQMQHWKGENGAYCAGLSRQGLHGISVDAKNIAEDISQILLSENM
jgi:hypothetical protein